MRAALTSMVLGLLAACSPAPIGEYPDIDVELPGRTGDGADAGSAEGGDGGPTQRFTLTVSIAGSGTGSVTSTPSGISCQDKTCTGSFAAGTTVGLVPAPDTGSTFIGWGGACSGTGVCTPVVNADVAVTATLEATLLPGTYTGTYTNVRMANGCTFNNTGNLTINVAVEGSGFTTTGSVTGLQLRQAGTCNVVGTATGTAQKDVVNLNGKAITGTWTFTIPNINGSLAFPYTATFADGTLSGTWTCATCTGSFNLKKQ